MKTILLNPVTWDLTIDASRNIALASDPYSKAQDVASACKLFKGELWYRTEKGIPYFQSIFGKNPPLSLLKNEFEKAALSVPDVVEAVSAFSNITSGRVLNGKVDFTDTLGKTNGVTL
jgi:hypothetical protein